MNSISKTEGNDKNEKWVKFLQIPFFNIRTSDMYYHFLPAFYLFVGLSIGLYWFNFWLNINNFSFWKYLSFLQDYRYEVLLFMFPLLFISFKLIWVIISSFWWTLTHFTKKVDQKISKKVYKMVWRNSEILQYLNEFYKFDNEIKEKELSWWPVYWHIFHYVMDYYYAQENVYDDLRKAIFIRNIIATNLILMVLILIIWISLWKCIITLIYIIFLWVMSFFLYKIYNSSLKKYHLKLVLTFIYIYTNVKNIEEKNKNLNTPN